MNRLLLPMIFVFTLIIPPAFSQVAEKTADKLAPTDLNRVNVGQLAPDFTLENYDGNKISLSEFHGQKNVVLVFYRGHW
jgi:cytochrome oxidase Cu insertion factor (SCO1/SenC/PrrC family)